MKTMFNRIYTILILMVLIPVGLAAQTEKDPKAESILNRLSEKAQTYSTIHADFAFTQEDLKAGEKTVQEGNVIVSEEKFALTLGEFRVYNDGEITWTYDAELNEATKDLTEDVRDPDAPTFKEMLTLWEEGYKYKFKEELQTGGKTIQVIDLYPQKGNEKTYHTARLSIDKSKEEIVQILLLGKDGINYTYEIKSFQVNQPVKDSDFTFSPKKFPGCEIIDNVM
jgi:outer membrane lipoprotein-sorting protein